LKDLVLLAGIIAMFALLWPEATSGVDGDGRNLRIVFEATNGSDEATEALLTRIESTQRNLREHANISVVAYWDAVRALRSDENPFRVRLAKLADEGIDFIVCQQSLRDAEMKNGDLLPFTRTVRSGSEEARNRESQGWARVRDGESYVNPL